MVLKLYGSPFSTCTRRVTTILYEKQVPFELVPVDFFKGEHKTAEFKDQRHPFGQVPVLDDDGFILYESRAISWYIATKYADQGTPLIPADVQGQARLMQALSIEMSHFVWAERAVREAVINPQFRKIPMNPEVFQQYMNELETRLDAYDQILGKSKFLAGDQLTIVDLFHLPYGDMLKAAGSDIMQSPKRPNVARWYKEIQAREAWQANKSLVHVYRPQPVASVGIN